MSDLISRKALANELQKYFVNNTIHKNDLAEVLATRPTAFDVEAVVNVVREAGANLCANKCCNNNCDCCVVDDALRTIIDAIRKGGVK